MATRRLRAATLIGLSSLSGIPACLIALFPGELPHFGDTQGMIRSVFPALAWGSVGGIAITAMIGQRLSCRTMLRISLALCGITLVASSQAWSMTALVVFLALASAGSAAAGIAMCSLLTALFPQGPRRVLALQLAVASGIAIVFPLVAAALHHSSGVAATDSPTGFLTPTLAGLGIVLLAGTTLLRNDGDERRVGTTSAPLQRDESVVLSAAVLLGSLHGGIDSALYQWAPTFFATGFERVVFPPAWILSGYAASYLVGRVLLSLAPDHLWERHLLIFPGAIGGGLLLLCLSCSSYEAAAALYIAASLAFGLQYPALIGMVARRLQPRLGMVLAFSGIGAAIGWALLTMLIGQLSQAMPLRQALIVMPIGLLGFSAIALLLVTRKPGLHTSAAFDCDAVKPAALAA